MEIDGNEWGRVEVQIMGVAIRENERTGRGLVVRLANGIEVPLVVGPARYKALMGDSRSEHSIRNDCEAGIIPTLPRPEGSGSHHRIPVAKALDGLGVPYEIAEAT